MFTCLYLHDTTLIKDRALAVFVKCMLKTCALVRDVVIEGDVYEEEDFVTHTSGFDLLSQAPPPPPTLAAAARCPRRKCSPRSRRWRKACRLASKP